MGGAAEEGRARLRAAMAAYEGSPLHRRVLQRLLGHAPTAADRERLRRLEAGPAGRLAEDALRLLRTTAAITEATVQRGLPEDLTLAELRAITEELAGRRVTLAEALVPDVSLPFRTSPEQSDLLVRLLPGLPLPRVPVRRYAALTEAAAAGPLARPQPFLVYESEGRAGSRRILGRLWLDADFLRHEEGFGAVDTDDLRRLEELVAGDLWATLATREALEREP